MTARSLPEPFSWISRASWSHLLETFPEDRKGGRAYAIAIYVALAVIATEQRRPDHAGIEASRRRIATAAGVSPHTVDTYVQRMVDAGLVTKARRSDRSVHLANVWTLIEPGPPAGGSPPGGLPPSALDSLGVDHRATNGGPPDQPVNQEEKNQEEQPTTTTAPTPAMNGEVVEAIEAMRARGVFKPDKLIELAQPEVILDTCAWYDRQRNVSPGLLVDKIRGGGIEDPAAVQRRERERFVRDHPCDREGRAARAWSKVLASLQGDSSWASLTMFLAGSHPHLGPEDGPLIIGVDPLKANWLRSRLTSGHLRRLAGARPLEICACPLAGRVDEEEALVEAIKREFAATELDEREWAEMAVGGVVTWDFSSSADPGLQVLVGTEEPA